MIKQLNYSLNQHVIWSLEILQDKLHYAALFYVTALYNISYKQPL